ncbi:MAG TPA: hypothetical protein VK807_23320 [Gemmatimonadaceae bacterium]|jgi:hypothetical protein|nr:hypothetical protein [Gemmatimonadaceae bacterium]
MALFYVLLGAAIIATAMEVSPQAGGLLLALLVITMLVEGPTLLESPTP